MKIFFSLLLATVFLFSCNNKKQAVVKDSDVYYTCSMDPQVVEARPGKCPICHMVLTPVRKSQQQNNDEIQLSPEQIQLGNIHTDTLRDGAIGDQIVLTAILNFDQTKTNALSVRIGGRIDKLYFKNTGDYIPKGTKLFDLYSEELNNAKQEYLLALQKEKVLGYAGVDYKQLVASAQNKLLLWGMTEAQVKELAVAGQAGLLTSFYSTASGYITELDVKEGDYVTTGGSIVRLADLSTLWAETQVYASQYTRLNTAATACVQIPDIPGKEIKGSISFINPEINPNTRIALVRVNIPNNDHLLKPGMPAYVIIKESQRKTLSLSTDAVLRDGKMAMVWVQVGSNKFVSKMVETGHEGDGWIEIKSGLKPGDIVVTSGAYLLQSEYIFRKGANPMAGHDMSSMKM